MIYVSVWVVIWGTAASLVDWLLLNADLYETGSFGQVATFIGYGAAAAVLAVKASGRFLGGGQRRGRRELRLVLHGFRCDQSGDESCGMADPAHTSR